MFSLGFLFLLYSAAEGAASPISCYNDHGDSVDWIYLYKLPHHRHQQDEGLKYLLMDGGSEGWTEGKGLVNDSTGALGRTVGQLYEQNVWFQGGEIAYILYNDQKPDHEKGTDGDRNRGGHTKGVVLVGKTQGYWLVHSTPHFPPVKEGGEFSYPHSGIKNGQNFLCVTYPLGMFQTIGEQLQINEPFVYDCNVPDSMASVLPSLAEVCRRAKAEGRHVSLSHSAHFSPPPSNRSISLLSLAGTKFVSFAKSASFGNDLYHSWVAPTLQSDLLVQFWHLSKGILPSDCSLNWKVLNIKTISLGQSTTFNSTLDHSKWAASTGSGGQNEAGAWICVGDINRNKAEEKRGGGTVCQSNPTVWKAYRNAVKESYPCK